jgi:glycosyltransferase involved in cell wall biosynthesis
MKGLAIDKAPRSPARLKRPYVTAFPGRRDGYQLPLSLAENGRLAAFVTCFYRNRGLLGRLPLGGRLQERQVAGIAPEAVECMEFTNLSARLLQRVLQPSRIGVWEDLAFARRAVECARQFKASMVLYEFQADWAFRQPLRHDAARILYQFHPHPDLEHPLLLEDGKRYPQFMAGIQRNTRGNLPRFYREHTRGAWRHADHVIVASHFTARSLEVAGCPADKISVVPYGCNIAADVETRNEARPLDRPYFLFVGSGTQRKGLHHLLEAWSHSDLGATHELVVIARVVDDELQGPLNNAKAVRHIPGVGCATLAQWYRSAVAFVLPSLSEGFGHVYLEALASGCPVIGTRNSMLPDFAEAQPHIRYAEPGDPQSIRAALEHVARLHPSDPFFATQSVRESVTRRTHQRFRSELESVLERFDR